MNYKKIWGKGRKPGRKTKKGIALFTLSILLLSFSIFNNFSYGEENDKQDTFNKISSGVKGDVRLRYQWEKKAVSDSRSRFRLRFRLGSEFDLSKDLSCGFGLASGGGDPRSTNATLENSFETKSIQLNYSFIEYAGLSESKIWAGKYKGIKKALWLVSDLLWDSDITPEGIGIMYKHSPENGAVNEFFTNVGILILDENKSSSDPMMMYIQPSVAFNLTEKVSARVGLSYYIAGVQGKTLNYSSGTNSTSGGGLQYDLSAYSASFEVAVKDLFVQTPYFSIFGDYINNSEPSKENSGYAFGAKLGVKKVKEFNDWQFKGLYRSLDKDAWLDMLPDSDSYGGETEVSGYELILSYGLGHNVLLGLDYYNMEDASSTTQSIFQLDFVFSF